MNSVGKRLQQARMRRKLSVEDAARATKVRAERILDLENDTYANFPNLAYGKGFLIIYAKFLAVDISDFVESFGVSSPVGRHDYQYLANAPEVRPAVRRREGPATRPMLIAAGLLAVLVVCGVFIMYLVVSAQRLGFIEQPGARKTAANLFAASTPGPSSAGIEVATPMPMSTPLVPRATPALALAAPGLPMAGISPFTAFSPAPAVPKLTPGAAASASPVENNEVVLQPLKKTWVTVRKDDADAPPLFEDWLYPDAKGLTLHGGKFWISVGEKGAVEIKKNGVLVNYDTSVAIQ